MENEPKYDQIERYLHQQMSKEEQKSFEETMKTDAALQEEVQLHQEVEDTLKNEEVHAFRSALKEVNTSWQKPIEKERGRRVSGREGMGRRLILRRVVSIAAVLGIGIVAFLYLWNASDANTNDLFTQYYQPYQLIIEERSVPIEEQSELKQALQSYKEKDFAKAAEAFENLAKAKPEVTAFPFYAGLSYLANNNAEKAIPLLENIVDSNDLLFAQQARWYLALSYLQLDDTNKAVSILEQIEKGNYQHQQATELLERLR
jgi:TolA-binding protein